ncbi:MAG: AMP-binding enzyme, partial [Candidatus Heimdallarchaeaceae archaeon]
GKAYIVSKEGFKLTEKEMINHCQKSLSKYKIPKEFEFIKELPLSAAGKVLKRELTQTNTK